MDNNGDSLGFYYFWLSHLYLISKRKMVELLQCFPSLPELFSETVPWDCFPKFSDRDREIFEKSRDRKKLTEEYEQLPRRYPGLTFLPFSDSRYPELLKNIYDPPFGLYVYGNPAFLSRDCIAIVGTRNCTYYGSTCAQSIANYLAVNGAVVVSGMARGIDSFAHKGALEAHAPTIAVLGGGANICYPRENSDIYHKIPENGCILSETPPDTPPYQFTFPLRNRIISGLSHSVVVIEAKRKSGSLITADYALEQGKNIFALPGRIHDINSEGCNDLLKRGAMPVLHPEDILLDLPETVQKRISQFDVKMNFKKKTLEKGEILLYSSMDYEPLHIDTLARRAGMSVREASVLLMSLQMKGYVVQPASDYYMKQIEF